MNRQNSPGAIFRRFGEVEGRAVGSPLYERLCVGVAEDPEVLDLVTLCKPGQPPPNMLFASVHYLLLAGADHVLRDYYADLTPEPRSPDTAYPAFRDFCLGRRDELEQLLATRRVQTNVVHRSVCILPALATIAELAEGHELAQIEIGASAGLNLLWERYRYRYGSEVTWGTPSSAVELSTDMRGDVALPAIPGDLRATWSAGIDVSPVDVDDDDAVTWLRALIWPENHDQNDELSAAIDVARENPPRLLKGDAAELAPDLLESAPPSVPLCVFATHSLNQFPADSLRRLLEAMQTRSLVRPVYLLTMQQAGHPHSQLTLTIYREGATRVVQLANCHPHGRWLQWLNDAQSMPASD